MFNFSSHPKSVCALSGEEPTKYCFFTQCSIIA